MRILGSIVAPSTTLMSSCDSKITCSGGIRSQIVRDQLLWDKAILLQQLAHEFQRGTLVPPAFDQGGKLMVRHVNRSAPAPSSRPISRGKAHIRSEARFRSEVAAHRPFQACGLFPDAGRCDCGVLCSGSRAASDGYPFAIPAGVPDRYARPSSLIPCPAAGRSQALPGCRPRSRAPGASRAGPRASRGMAGGG